MPTFITKESWSRNSGFTLMELMVVVLLLSLATGILFSVGLADDDGKPEQQLRLFSAEIQHWRNEAVLRGALMGLDFYSGHEQSSNGAEYRWLQWVDGDWVIPENDAGMARGSFDRVAVQLASDGVVFALEQTLQADSSERFSPEILFYPTHEVTPFSLELTSLDASMAMLSVDMLGQVRLNETAPELY